MIPHPPYRSIRRSWATTSSPEWSEGSWFREREAADVAALGGVVEDAAADPGDAVGARALAREGEALLQVVDVRGAVQAVALPRRCPRLHVLGLDAVLEELDRLLLPADIPEEAQADQRRADEPAAFPLDRRDEALDEVGLEDDVVVDEERVGGARLVEEELALLGHPSPREVLVELDLVPERAEHAHDRLHLAHRRCIEVLRLVGDDDPRSTVGLRDQARERDGESRRAAVGGNEDVEHG